MKIPLWFQRIAFVCLVSAFSGVGVSADASAPTTLAGFIYYDSVDAILMIPTVQRGLMLQDDGTFRGLYTLVGSAVSAPADGVWAYRRINESDSELTLTVGTVSQRRVLRFSSDLSGYIVPSSLIIGELSGNFQIAPAAVRSPLVNCSNRSFVRASGVAFTGFVISGSLPRTILVRAVGSGLTAFGIPDALPNPKLALTRDGRLVAQNDDWDAQGGSESIRRVSAFVGAFPLAGASRDAALVIRLAPGPYVVEAAATAAQDSGQVIVEVYVLP